MFKLSDWIKQSVNMIFQNNELKNLPSVLKIDVPVNGAECDIENDGNIVCEVPIIYETIMDSIVEELIVDDRHDIIYESQFNTVAVKTDGSLIVNLGIDEIFKDKIAKQAF